MLRFKSIAQLAGFAVASLLTACIAEPYDGEIVAQNPTTIIPRMQGYGTAAGQDVTIFARNASGTFVEVTSTTTGSTGWSWAGSTWYGWVIDDFNLPLAYWTDKPGGCGRRATLRTQIGNYNGYSVDQPFASCWSPTQTANEFIDACVSDESPNVTIETCGALCC
jgi:hypothetical protein